MDNHTVYILHFSHPYWQAGKSSCQHYVGYTKDLSARIAKHRRGDGSKLCAYAALKGIKFIVVKAEEFPTQSEARKRELWIKRNGGGKRFCPICQHPGLDFKDISAVMAEEEQP